MSGRHNSQAGNQAGEQVDEQARDQEIDELVALLQERSWQLAVAESLTGGLLATHIASWPGAGDVFAGGVVAYATRVKREVLDVPDCPVISSECAAAMAVGVARLLRVDVGLALTGVAGPDRQEDQPVGLVFGACALDGDVTTARWQFDGDPNDVRDAAVAAIVELVHHQLLALPAHVR